MYGRMCLGRLVHRYLVFCEERRCEKSKIRATLSVEHIRTQITVYRGLEKHSLREGLMSLLPKVVYSTGSDVARHQTIEIR